jgi:hypothetical protein
MRNFAKGFGVVSFLLSNSCEVERFISDRKFDTPISKLEPDVKRALAEADAPETPRAPTRPKNVQRMVTVKFDEAWSSEESGNALY